MSNHESNQPMRYAGNNDPPCTQDIVIEYIEKMLDGVPLTPQEQSIFKVRSQLRKVNERAYEPEILSIGPYNYKNDKFKFMNEQKKRYVKQLLRRRNERVVSYMPALKELEQQARNCYAETIDLTPEEFLEMMFIDGCFIVELFYKYDRKELRDEDYETTKSKWIRVCLRRDLLLLENQLPLVVLSKLYDLTRGPNDHPELFDIAIKYFYNQLGGLNPNETHRDELHDKLHESKHLLHLMHTCWTYGLLDKPSQNCGTNLNKFVSTAMELRESGVKLRVRQECDRMDIKFDNGILEIPFLIVQDDTESLFRNLIAYEQHRQGRDINYVTEYISFMDCLINSSKDVKLLRRKGIIKNYLGDDEVVAQMFNKICDNVARSDSFYADISREVNAYCDRKRNVRMAKLKREYLHSPWAFLSILAATVLLLLTAAQTVFTILSYTKQ